MAAVKSIPLRDLVVGRSYRLLNPTTVIPGSGIIPSFEPSTNETLQRLHRRPHILFSKIPKLSGDNFFIHFNVRPENETSDGRLSVDSSGLPEGINTLFIEESITGGKRRKSRKQKRRAKKTRKH